MMKLQFETKQQGLAFWGFLWGLVLFVCFCYILILSIPPYVNNQKIHNALISLAEEPGIMTMHRSDMVRRIKRKLNIDFGDQIVNIDKAFKAKTVDGKRELSMDYELQQSVAYNVSLLFDFKNHVTAPVN